MARANDEFGGSWKLVCTRNNMCMEREMNLEKLVKARRELVCPSRGNKKKLVKNFERTLRVSSYVSEEYSLWAHMLSLFVERKNHMSSLLILKENLTCGTQIIHFINER